jgi:hypothetical protein
MASLNIRDILVALVGLVLFIVFISLIQTVIRAGWLFITSQIRKVFELLTSTRKEDKGSFESQLSEEDD